MAKAAVDQFTRSIATELSSKGVRVNAVAPGALKSRFNMRFGDILTSEEQLLKVLYSIHKNNNTFFLFESTVNQLNLAAVNFSFLVKFE